MTVKNMYDQLKPEDKELSDKLDAMLGEKDREYLTVVSTRVGEGQARIQLFSNVDQEYVVVLMMKIMDKILDDQEFSRVALAFEARSAIRNMEVEDSGEKAN